MPAFKNHQSDWRPAKKRGFNIFSLLFLIIIAIVVYSGFKIYLEAHVVDQEIARLKSQANYFQSENATLQQEKDRALSNNFSEKEARVKLNLQKPGETAVFFVQNDSSTSSFDTQNNLPAYFANALRWWHVIFP